MQYRRDVAGMAKFLTGPDARRVVTLAAAARLAKARGLMRRDTGATAASGRLVQHSRGGRKNDRVMVSVTFGGTAVAQQFGNKRTRATRPLTRAFED
jgi:hypothetical protein